LLKEEIFIWCVDEEGAPVDKLKTTGLEIIRSETPEAVRPRLKNNNESYFKSNTSDDELINIIERYKKELKETDLLQYFKGIENELGIMNDEFNTMLPNINNITDSFNNMMSNF